MNCVDNIVIETPNMLRNIYENIHYRKINQNNFYKKNKYCSNCRSRNHTKDSCTYPAMSFGVIMCKIIPSDKNVTNEEIKKRLGGSTEVLPKFDYTIQYLLISRKHSVDLVEFSRGTYHPNDKEKLKIIFSNITSEEKKIIAEAKSFDDIWCYVWNTKIENGQLKFEKKKHKTDYRRAKYNYEFLLRNGLNKLLIETPSKKIEWGFPKGKKNKNESNFSCAKREFEEETGLKNNEYFLIKNILPEKETFIGSDNKNYNYVYYTGVINDTNISLKIDQLNRHQCNEIGNIKWATYEEAVQMISSEQTYDRLRILRTIDCFVRSRLK